LRIPEIVAAGSIAAPPRLGESAADFGQRAGGENRRQYWQLTPASFRTSMTVFEA